MTVNGTGGYIVLGAGGPRARIDVLNACLAQAETRLDLPGGHSVYAVALSPDGTELACGTRGGSIYWIANGESGQAQHPLRAHQGAPILSVCYADPDHVVSSDTAGRCFLWRTRSDAGPLSLPTSQHVVCSLLPLDDGRIVGLSTVGDLLFWRRAERDLIEVAEVAAPAPVSALVNLVYWRAARALAYPGRDGQLVVFDLGGADTRILSAHEGEFYAVTEVEDDLLSIGLKDERLARWGVGHDEPAITLEAPAGVTSCALAGIDPSHLTVTHTDGSASVCTIEPSQLRVEARFRTAEYRVAVGFSWRRHREHQRAQLQREAGTLAAAIESQLERGELEGLDDLHTRLSALGFRHVSLSLRATQHRLADNPIGELRACAELASLLPQNASESTEWLERYAELLTRFGQFPEAFGLNSRITAAASGLECNPQDATFAEATSALERGDCVVETDVPILTLIEAAGAIGRPFSGRFIMLKLDLRHCRDVRLSTADILEKYNYVRSQMSVGRLPPANCETTRWLRRNTCERVELLTIGGTDTTEAAGLELGLRVAGTRSQTAVETMVLFGVRQRQANEPVESHNQRVGARFQVLVDRSGFNSWIRPIRRAVGLTLRLLVTDKLGGHMSRAS